MFYDGLLALRASPRPVPAVRFPGCPKTGKRMASGNPTARVKILVTIDHFLADPGRVATGHPKSVGFLDLLAPPRKCFGKS